MHGVKAYDEGCRCSLCKGAKARKRARQRTDFVGCVARYCLEEGQFDAINDDGKVVKTCTTHAAAMTEIAL